jgi:hypothetical protein
MGFITVDLRAAGLTHAKGKSDGCGGEHDIDEKFVVADVTGRVHADDLGPVLQALHEQAHPDGAAYFENCLEPACAGARELLDADGS